METTINLPKNATNVRVIYDEPELNEAPTASAGADQVITLPTNTVTLIGDGNDADGTIVGYEWNCLTEKPCSIATPKEAKTIVSGLVEGVYTFQLKVTDDDGASTFSTSTVTVKPAIVIPPSDGYKLVYALNLTDDKQVMKNIADHNQVGRGGWQLFEGEGVFRSEVRSGDSQTSQGFRSELQDPGDILPNEGRITYKAFFSTLFQSQGHSFQLHPNQSGPSATLALWHSGGKFQVVRQVDYQNRTNIYQQGTLKTIPVKQWIKFDWQYKMSTGSDGYVRLYINDQLYFEVKNTKTATGLGQYAKLGANLFVSQNSLIYYKEYNVYQKV